MADETSEEHRVPEPPRRRSRDRRVQPVTTSRDGWLLLESSGWYIRLTDILDNPTTAVLASEDSAWKFGLLDWRSRRPRAWHRPAREDWRAERRVLEAKRVRLVQSTRQVRTLRPVDQARK